MPKQIQLAILASGNGTNAQQIAEYFSGNPDVNVNVIIYEPVFHEGQRFNPVAGIFPSSGTLFHSFNSCPVRTILSG